MNRLLYAIPILLTAAVPALAAEAAAPRTERPNIIFLLADDLGYGDLGSYGQKKIRTPHLDRLAAGGMRFTQHYSGNAVCAPSRCVLMTGMHPGHAVVRNNRGIPPEGQFPLPDETVTMAELLQQQGYVTGAFGKWGMGGPDSPGAPLRQGIDRFYGYNCQTVAHNFYPTYLWDDDRRQPLDNPPFSPKQKFPRDADPNDPANYERYTAKDYAPDFITEQSLKFIRDNQDRPFFLYYPTTVPHLALQVPDDSLAEYAGKFPEEPYDGTRGYLPHLTPRAAYAAMITRLDRDIGRMLTLLEELGLADNTIVVFTSDNGPLYDKLGGTDEEFFNSAGGLRGRKGSLYEGGVRVPCIVRWPGKVEAGSVSDRVTGFEDWLPTLLELAGAKAEIPANVDGISFAPTLLGQSQPPRPYLYREFPAYGSQQSVRFGDWKGIRVDMAKKSRKGGTAPIELYNIADDPREEHNVAAEHPEIVAKVETLFAKLRTPSEEFPLPGVDK